MEKSAKKRRICENDGTTTGPSCSHGMVTSSGYEYEVFLSFRGPDTREGFTDFLYTSLKDAGIRTFRDDEDLRKGEDFGPELLQAIEQSKILIPIFSRDYASSVWCLKEVAQMVECVKTGGQKIIPIFYDVAPAEVRYQNGGYGEAFRSHEIKGRYDKETISHWKAALNAVGDINGWDLHGKTDRREGQFVKTCSQKVLSELKKASLVVSDCLVGVDDQVDKVMEMIGAWTSKTRIVGIHGMGGIGKTTIAKIVYNQLSEKFNNRCFLSNIREESKTKGIVSLQKQLISGILKTEWANIPYSEEGTRTIQERLSKKEVLILLDDVDREKDINALLGDHGWLGEGSKVIITTRDKEVLKLHGVEPPYEVNFMDSEQSLQLFSRHAFRRDHPLDEYITLSKRAVGIANGLPLALETMGSLLGCTAKEKWGFKLDKLEDVPCKDVQGRLRISYDGLEDPEKHIFLDIACLFIGYDKDTAVHFWESKFHPEDAMDVLENMSLIKIKDDRTVWMHDLFRDLGRKIVREESKMKIEEQSRVWNTMDALNLLTRHEENTKVEALRLILDHKRQRRFTYEDFKRLSNLRFLEVGVLRGDITAEGRLLWNERDLHSNILRQLRWLCLHNILPTFNITNFSMENVVILGLSNSKITDDWEGWSHMKVMKLKILDLSHCGCLTRTPNFSAHPNLERLFLRNCWSLIKLDKSICQLKHLIFLDLSFCRNLRRLPDDLGGDLASLEYLSLWACESLERLPDTIGNLISLIELNISRTKIEELPDSIGKLEKLKVVEVGSKIRKIPNALWKIEKLEKIKASGNFTWVDPSLDIRDGHHSQGNIDSCIYGNKSLRILKIVMLEICVLPRLPEGLVTLHLSWLKMDTFPDLSNLANLKELQLFFIPRNSDGPVEEYPMPQWIGNLTKLEYLHLGGCHFVTTLQIDLNPPPRLKKLDLNWLNLRHLPKLPPSLSSLYLKDCQSLCLMEDLSNLKKLTHLCILDAAITEIQGLGDLENLRDLRLHWLKQVKTLPDLSNLNKLRSLDVSYCANLVEIQGERPQSLEKLEISGCTSLLKFPDLSSLKVLQTVRISDCGDLVKIQGELPQSLKQLRISSCKSLRELPNLSSSMGLRLVSIFECGNLVEIQGDLPQSLEDLKVDSCKSLQKLPSLSSFMGLRYVHIRKCGDLVEIQGELPQPLKQLQIDSCKSLRELPNLSSSMGLRFVSICKCGNLVEIQGDLPQSLEYLKVDSCESLEKLPNLSSIKGLQEVNIKHCRKLNAEAISSLCRDNSVKFVGEDEESEYESEGKDEESDYESEGEVEESDYESMGEDEESVQFS